MTKACSRCKAEKPLEDFGARPKNTDGRKGVCRRCESDNMLDWNKKHREKVRARSRELGTVPKSRFSRFKKRCVFTDKHFDLTFEQWCALVIGKTCHYCAGPLQKKGCGLDRKDNALGYIVGNVVACCKECNRLKGPTLTHAEMLAVSELLLQMRSK
jgi:hypothetical protein